MGNVPNLRFPEFTEEWEKCKFGDIATGFDYGMNAAAKPFDGENKYIRITDIDEASSTYNDKDLVSPDGILTDNYVVNDRDILLARTGASTGKSYLYKKNDGKLYYAGFLIRANVPEHDPYFVFSQLHTHRYWRWVSIMSARSGQPGINSQEYSSFPIFTTSLQEESKISTLLSLLDERIATQNKIIDKLQSLISGLNDYLHLQVGGLSTSFEELGTSYSGLSGKSGDDFGKGKPYITYLNIYSNSIVNEEQVDYVIIGDNEKQNTLLYGDLLFTLSSETPDEVGIGAVYLGESDKYYLNSFCFGLHMTAASKVYSPYLAYLVSNSIFRKFIYPLAQGSTRFNLHKNDFMKKKFLLPTFENQKEIARTLNALSSKVETERKLLLNYQEQRQYLLGAMFI